MKTWNDDERISPKSLMDGLYDLYDEITENDYDEIKVHEKELTLLDEIANGWKHNLVHNFVDEYWRMLVAEMNNNPRVKTNPWKVWEEIISRSETVEKANELDEHLPELIRAIKNVVYSTDEDEELYNALENETNKIIAIL
jgi:hypothetical protein